MSARRRGLFARRFRPFELVVVAIAVALLAGLALDRLLPLLGRAQRVAFLQVRGNLQSALRLEAAARITRGESSRLAELRSANPMTLLLSAPANYLGALEQPHPDTLPGASWYYDEGERALVYRVGSHTKFDPLNGPPNLIAFKVTFAYEDRDGDGVFDASRDRFNGLKLDPANAFDWPD